MRQTCVQGTGCAKLFDEPTSALDPEFVTEVLKVIHDLAEEGRTMLIVTHEIGFAREVSSRTVFLHRGIIEEQGPSRALLEDPRSDRLKRFLSGDHGGVQSMTPFNRHRRRKVE